VVAVEADECGADVGEPAECVDAEGSGAAEDYEAGDGGRCSTVATLTTVFASDAVVDDALAAVDSALKSVAVGDDCFACAYCLGSGAR
jgi:hypothetical protein